MAEAAAFQGSPDSLTSGLSPSGTNASEGAHTTLSGASGASPSHPPLKPEPSSDMSGNFPPPRTDKPRPHVCNTCGRSFARLEHLKRHERSHTKEKPFECTECTRCFARRDLLLRHQQKLHLTGATSTRSKPRRESTTGVNASARVRKSSVASSNGSGSIGNNMRPRANTISHIDANNMSFMSPSNRPAMNGDSENGLAQHFNMMRGMGNFTLGGMSSTISGHGNPQGLPRLATQGLGLDLGNDLRTAPPGPMMDSGFDVDQIFSGGTTINPAQLHLDDSVGSSTGSPFNKHFPPFAGGQALMEEDENFDWMRGFNAQMNFNTSNDEAIVESSPSAMSNDGQNGMNDQPLQGQGHPNQQNNVNMWQPHLVASQSMSNAQNADANGMFPEFINTGDTISPKSLHGQNGVEGMYSDPQAMAAMSPHSPMAGMPYQFQQPMTFNSDTGSISSTSANGSARRSSVASNATESISEVTRQALLISLSQPSVFGHGHRKYSQPTISSPLSPREGSKTTGNRASLPSTADLQRYVNAYIQFFHPHFPFLHIPTLSFDAPAYTTNLRPANSGGNFGAGGLVGGGGCLILAMAAIGALYESDRTASRELFESAKKMIQLYLEERRKADMSSTGNRPGSDYAAQNTPLWLVQSMLLNVIYGHNCGDKIAGDIASTHCTALVSLARAADLVKPLPNSRTAEELYNEGQQFNSSGDINMSDNGVFPNPFNLGSNVEDERIQWHRWVVIEERKRTLFAIFHLSSLLVSGYNHAPALMNSEIQLDLPCEEDLWATETARAWSLKGGLQAAEQGAIPFATALSTLLTASQNQAEQGFTYNQPFGSGIPLSDLPSSNLRPSTFGCLVLINALHNYIWETRQRHSGRKWTTQETESMHAHIEPALRAWQSAWASNPTHSLERPNPSGCGPLSADSIPLLDLAYVRLFVNLGSSKEAFWAREFDVMAEELAKGSEFVQHAEHSDPTTDVTNSANGSRGSPGGNGQNDETTKADVSEDMMTVPPATTTEQLNQSSKRERHLRRAAFYAADSMAMSHKLGVTFADFTSRELPIQSALCTFDCAQVIAEWAATVQERVGRYIGILGRDDIDYSQVPAIMLLEDEDCKLLEKISDILAKAEAKITFEMGNMGASDAMAASNSLPSLSNWGIGSKILMVTAFMLQRAAVWPVTSIMAHGLEIQAEHMNKRAENSTGVSG